MSKSYRKIPICGNTGDSDREYKKKLHKKARKITKLNIKKGKYDELGRILPYNHYSSNKDGKNKFFNLKIKDIKLFRKLMRK